MSRPAQLGCFGLHEWAMVHGIPADDVRHAGWPLRLGSDGTDAVVERHGIRCSHFDAYRFFTESARPRNALRPTRDSQVAMEQPGCLHAGMDVYKWAFKLTPLVPSDLVADAFDLAREIRVLDMEASPYDLRELGYTPVPIETPEGKAAYLERQRAFAERSNALRHRLLAVLDSAAADLPAGGLTARHRRATRARHRHASPNRRHDPRGSQCSHLNKPSTRTADGEEVAPYIPRGSRTVLEVGCGRGGFGRTLRSALGPQARIVGVEAVPEQAEIAAHDHGFDAVATGYFPEALPEGEGLFDLVVFNDVLEHILEPEDLLNALRTMPVVSAETVAGATTSALTAG